MQVIFNIPIDKLAKFCYTDVVDDRWNLNENSWAFGLGVFFYARSNGSVRS